MTTVKEFLIDLINGGLIITVTLRAIQAGNLFPLDYFFMVTTAILFLISIVIKK